MKLSDKEKERLKKDIQHPDPDRQKREFMDSEQKHKNDPEALKKEKPIKGLEPREETGKKKKDR
ncbi:hypothetical protein [Christiangramia crocea]|uniref:Uncharacterized protein n=1 Tax=Christiangramia crocea TaxID=2904124 RepID=A0A9X1V069_9FLAO|nr:hypothetical protein [Gramella crocea]MCG9973270.1 hypothetical protein [Gramella crocea]